ncbi:MAG TPA: alpha/beta fold hydrolase [Acidimicrobiales bacterium]|nr:alpha/beta fold hydrolase [Acidimicrobiales bacterium]
MSDLPGGVGVETDVGTSGGYRIYARCLRPAVAPAATIVVVHGMVVAGRGTLPLARALARQGFVVHVPDLPGFGRSAKPARALDVAGLGGALAGWVRDRVGGPVTLVGNSFGTQVAARAAADSPGLASAVVLVAPTIDARFRRRWAEHLPAGPPAPSPPPVASHPLRDRLVDRLVPDEADPAGLSLRRLVVSEYLAAGPARALSTYRHALRDDLVRTVGRIDSPVVVVRGGSDGVVSPGWARQVAAAAPRGVWVDVPGADHDGQFHAPELLAATVVHAAFE